MSWFLPFFEQNTHLRVLTGFSGAGRRLLLDLAMGLSLSQFKLVSVDLEGRFFVSAAVGAGRGSTAPRIVLRLRTARLTRSAAESTAAAATAAGLVHLGR